MKKKKGYKSHEMNNEVQIASMLADRKIKSRGVRVRKRSTAVNETTAVKEGLFGGSDPHTTYHRTHKYTPLL
jgi:hypothetical protein